MGASCSGDRPAHAEHVESAGSGERLDDLPGAMTSLPRVPSGPRSRRSSGTSPTWRPEGGAPGTGGPLLDMVGIANASRRAPLSPDERGMCQRAMIAMALAQHTALAIADEPTTALDVTTQAQISLMADLKADGTSIMPDPRPGRVAQSCQCGHVHGQRGGVHGREQHLQTPLHPYEGLMRSSHHRGQGGESLHAIPGNVPGLRDMPSGCTFHNRCEEVMEICTREYPPEFGPKPGHTVRCWRYAP